MRVQVAHPIADTSIFLFMDSPSGPLSYNAMLMICKTVPRVTAILMSTIEHEL